MKDDDIRISSFVIASHTRNPHAVPLLSHQRTEEPTEAELHPHSLVSRELCKPESFAREIVGSERAEIGDRKLIRWQSKLLRPKRAGPRNRLNR
jgi:hypothetical protein